MKIKNKLALISLLSTINIATLGCSKTTENELNVMNQTSIELDQLKEKPEQINIENVEKIDELNSNILVNLVKTEKNIIKAIDKTEIYSLDNNIVGTLAKDSSIEYVEELYNIYYVNYYGIDAYVLKDKVEKNILTDIASPIKKIGYATDNLNLIIPSYLNNGEEKTIEIPKLELIEIYDENDDIYVVKIDNKIGYINKINIQELNGTFVVVDISNQQLNLYQNNEVILSSPVVTGKPSSPSDEGIFEVYDISFNRDLVGPNYRSYVNVMMKYNGGEGLHDAEYHTDDNGKKHGWRNFSEFGSDTYLTNGSHGCVNMPHDLVMNVSEYVELGTKVLVKK